MEKKTLHEIVDKMKKRTLHEIADKHVYVPNCPSLAVLREQTFDLLDLLSAMYQIEDEERQKAFYGREIKRYIDKYSDNGRKRCLIPVTAGTLAFTLVSARLVTSPENILELTEK